MTEAKKEFSESLKYYTWNLLHRNILRKITRRYYPDFSVIGIKSHDPVPKHAIAIGLAKAIGKKVIYFGLNPEPGFIDATDEKGLNKVIELMQSEASYTVLIENLNLLMATIIEREEVLNPEAILQLKRVKMLAKQKQCYVVITSGASDFAKGINTFIDFRPGTSTCLIGRELSSYLDGSLTKEAISIIRANGKIQEVGNIEELKKILNILPGSNKAVRNAVDLVLGSGFETDFEVITNPTKLFKGLPGRNKIIERFSSLIGLYKNEKVADRLGVSRHNLLVFHGPPGAGKTHTAKILTAELGWPLVHVKARDIFSEDNPIRVITKMIRTARNLKRCIVFIDEAEKILARGTMDQDGPVHAALQEGIEGLDGTVSALFVFAINDTTRFGGPLMDRFTVFEFNPPTFEERMDFIMDKARKSRLSLDVEMMAKMTEGLSYRQIQKIWNKAVCSSMPSPKPEAFESAVIDFKNESRSNRSAEMFG
ncbi:MAG: AAA family ATPase [Candidatus Woesearchaeota archaeon]